jgi:hypothetical protein
MPMNFISETEQISNELKKVDGYLACEKIIIKNIIKQLERNLDDVSNETYLKDLALHLEKIPETGKDDNMHINNRFAIGFVNTLLRTPSWKNWVKTIGIAAP